MSTQPTASVLTRARLTCGEPLLSSARMDKTTCGPRCRTRLCRTREATRNTSVTRSDATTPRSDGWANARPPGGQTWPIGASLQALPAVPLAMSPRSKIGSGPPQAPRVYPDRLARVLAEGLLAIEERRAREQTGSRNRAIIVPPTTEEQSDEPAQQP
jgi:hypothetical protein